MKSDYTILGEKFVKIGKDDIIKVGAFQSRKGRIPFIVDDDMIGDIPKSFKHREFYNPITE